MEKTPFLSEVLGALKKQRIDLIILRKYERVPADVSIDQDIDMLCRRRQREALIKELTSSGFTLRTDDPAQNIYLYGSYPHDHFIHKDAGVYLDVAYALAYRSLNKGEWIPVSGSIQSSIWENKKEGGSPALYYKPSGTDELVHILCHCILDKRKVDEYYRKRINVLLKEADGTLLEKMLGKVFMRFAPQLLKLIRSDKTNQLFEEYTRFSDY